MYYAVMIQKAENAKWYFHSGSTDKTKADSHLDKNDRNALYDWKVLQLTSKDRVDAELEFLNKDYDSSPKFSLYSNIGNREHIGVYPDMDTACCKASNIIAKRYGLPEGKYRLQWGNTILRDDEYTRIYESNGGDFRIVALQY